MSQTSVITTLADAVAAELNGAPAEVFDHAFTAERHYRPRFKVEDLVELRVSIVPKGVTIQGATRNAHTHELQVDVAVQRKLGPPDGEAAEIEQLMTLVQQIGDYLMRRRLQMLSGAAWARLENQPVYAVDHLDELRVFTSVLTLTYRVLR